MAGDRLGCSRRERGARRSGVLGLVRVDRRHRVLVRDRIRTRRAPGHLPADTAHGSHPPCAGCTRATSDVALVACVLPRRRSAIWCSVSCSAFSCRSENGLLRGEARRVSGRRGTPASTSSGIASVSATGRPSNRSTARRFAWPSRTQSASAGERRPQPGLVGLAQRHERAAAALDVEGCRAAEQDDVRTGDAGRPSARAPRPRQRCAVRLGRVGRREHERVVVGVGAQLAQPLDGAGERELRPAEPFDEVAATTGADRLERPQLAVDGAVPAGERPRRARRRATTIPCRSSSSSASARRSTAVGKSRVGERPASLRRGRPGGAGAREPAWPPVGDRRAVASRRTQRRPGVVRHLAGPHELPQRRERRLRARAPSRRGGRARTRPSVASATRSACAASPSGGGAPAGAPSKRRVRRGSRARRDRARRRPRRPRRSRRARRARPAGSPAPAGAAPRSPRARPAAASACSGTSASRRLARRSMPCQAGRKRPERGLLGRLDLLAQRRERRPPQPPQHVRIAPLALDAAGAELAADEPSARSSPPSTRSTTAGSRA